MDNGVKEKGILHFVRSRRMSRIATFDPNQVLPREEWTKCDSCDSEMVDKLSTHLLECLASASKMEQHSKCTDAIVCDLKKQLIDWMKLKEHFPNEYEKPEDEVYNHIEKLERHLDNFGKKKQSTFSKIVNMTHSKRQSLTGVAVRIAEITKRYFTKEERDAWASLAIRHHDTEFNYHCKNENCGDSCDFTVVKCPHEGCKVSLSRKYLADHDEDCPLKVIACARECGDKCRREQMEHHRTEVCVLRDAKCPFHLLGCDLVVRHKDIPEHLETNSNGHMLLAMNRMLEYQSVFSDLTGRIIQLEEEVKVAKATGAAVTVGLSSAVAALELQKKNQAKATTDSESSVMSSLSDQKKALEKRISALESTVKTHKTEFGKISEFLSKK